MSRRAPPTPFPCPSCGVLVFKVEVPNALGATGATKTEVVTAEPCATGYVQLFARPDGTVRAVALDHFTAESIRRAAGILAPGSYPLRRFHFCEPRQRSLPTGRPT